MASLIKRLVQFLNSPEQLQREIDERVRAEDALRESQALYQSLVESLPLNVFRKDQDGRIVFANGQFCETVGKSLEELIGKTDHDLFPKELADKYHRDDAFVVETGRVFEAVEEHRRSDGRMLHVQILKSPVRDAQGEIVGVQGMFRDVSERIQAESDLHRAKEEAEEANRAKSLFLASMSHEIRTPMNAVLGMTELVLDTTLTADQREYLMMVHESGESLMAVIDDILDFSKIEAGRLDLDHVDFDLPESLGDTLKSLGFRAHRKGLEMALRIAPDVPSVLHGDPRRLRQVIINLVGNAIKFTDQGEVVVRVETKSLLDDQVVLHFAVSDTGIGISSEQQAAIFDAFEQAQESTTRRVRGTGLGLAISSRLVELMGGRIWLTSEPGRGSTFHFSTMLAKAQSPVDRRQTGRSAKVIGTRTLVVEDHQTSRHIVEEMLHRWEIVPSVAANSQEALALVSKARDAGQPFELAIIDSRMPEIDGFELVERLQAEPEFEASLIMMLTSGDQSADVARCEQLGVAAYLIKPLKQSELFDAIAMALQISDPEETAHEVASLTPKTRALNILLAEDSLVNQKLAIGLLEKWGHRVTAASNGREASLMAKQQSFDLIIMDVEMPEMDGLAATEEIRATERFSGAHVPILAMTAYAMKGDRERCLEAGMDAYLAKPIRARQLMAAIEQLVKKSPEPVDDSQQETAPSTPDPSSQSLIDWEQALGSVQGDRQLLRDMIEAYLSESSQMLRQIRDAAERNDAAGVQHAAHTIKGSMRYFGASRAFDQATSLETQTRAGKMIGVTSLVAELEQELERLRPVLASFSSDPKH